MIALLLCLQACSEPIKEIKAESPMVVQLFKADIVNIASEYEFPATVSSVKSIDLKFEVSGRLVFANLVEGSMAAKGQVLARIDPAPFERQVAEQKYDLMMLYVTYRVLKRFLKKNWSLNMTLIAPSLNMLLPSWHLLMPSKI